MPEQPLRDQVAVVAGATRGAGRGIAVRADHTVEAEVEQLFARIRAEAGRLDVLVNDIWGGDTLAEWGRPFWELTVVQGQQMLERTVHSHIITSRHGAPLMIERDAGLIVEVTDGDTLASRPVSFCHKLRRIFGRRQGAMTSSGGYHPRKSNAAEGEKDQQIMAGTYGTRH